MAFMQKQITPKQTWLRVETSQGTEYIDAAGLGLFVRDSHTKTHPMTEAEFDATRKQIAQYTEATPETWENVKGYGARLSAPGYLDCTEWNVFDTQEEAEEFLEDTYGEEDEQ